MLDEAAVDLVARANEIVVLCYFDDHARREGFRAALLIMVAKAAAAERSRTLRHLVAHDRLDPFLPVGPNRGVILGRFSNVLLAGGLGGENHAAGARIDAVAV